jgi:hypothetical protein
MTIVSTSAAIRRTTAVVPAVRAIVFDFDGAQRPVRLRTPSLWKVPRLHAQVASDYGATGVRIRRNLANVEHLTRLAGVGNARL